MSSYGGDGGYRPGVGDRPGGWAPQAAVKRADAPNGMEVGVDFPFVCETCLGPNPFVRMVKLGFGDKLCKISGQPFQAFRWRAGAGGRWKETLVCPHVAKDKNICQACLVDMTYGVPVGVRDALLEAQSDQQLHMATSDPNSAFYWQQKQALATSNGSVQNLDASRQLLTLARSLQAQERKAETAWRNLPRLCSFWLAGTCTRVVQHKCPFRPCNGMFEFPEIAASNKDLRDGLIEKLQADGPATVMQSLDENTRAALKDALKGNKDEAIRKRFDGKDDQSKRYLRRARESAPELEPPEDQSIMSLWIGGVDPSITQEDVKDVFYSFGEVRAVRLLPDRNCGFVEFTTRGAAEQAARKLYRTLTIKGISMDLDWAKPQASAAKKDGASSTASSAIPPPPGMTGAAPQLDPAMQARLAASVMGAPNAKRQRTQPPPPAGAPPRGPPPPPPGPPPSQQSGAYKAKYPSMNPQRMGASEPKE